MTKTETIISEFERFIQEYDRDIGFTNYDSEVLKGVLALLKEQNAQLKEWEKYTGFLASHGVFETTIVPIEGVD